eukprot:gnl/TRDRNA2_/TRDRNA2_186158_c0_seq1.p1 gnl/TRDRNA2_/TRDRNA2_186158_c0~~gnl/TRDRNA2_/TRDRNA2_186158_c0_seq1.p1  ORF type:complete len:428 (-),score=72.79 gnl/TRDRNA2_/TRDRNA2_186158_c0_seq1:161-1417(-)
MAADFGLPRIARLLGKEEAFSTFMGAAAAEEAGDFLGSIKLYKQAFKMWDALDSVIDEGGLPTKVRREAEAAEIDIGAMPKDLTLDMEQSPRFDVDAVDEWLTHLKEQGYCILAGVADSTSIVRAKTLLWDFLESVPNTQVKRGDPSTWDASWLPNKSNGILGVHGFGQTDFCWHARMLPSVHKAFAAIWGSDDLIASFDGGNVFRPWANRREWRTVGGWWHVDQNSFLPNQDGLACVQGLVTFTDATPATGGLCVIPGSHKCHQDVCARAHAHIQAGHFVQVQPGDPVLELGARLVCAKAGDLLLWDSRCVHCNTPGSPESEEPSAVDESAEPSAVDDLVRIAAYVCMTATSRASPEVLTQRKEGFLNNETTDHVPHEFHGSGEALPWPPRKSWSIASCLQKKLIVGASAALQDQDQ